MTPKTKRKRNMTAWTSMMTMRIRKKPKKIFSTLNGYGEGFEVEDI